MTNARFSLTSISVWSLIVGVTAAHHERWFDEADAWLAARDCSLAELFAETPHMGTPAGWYLILMPFAKSGFPYWTMQVIHVLIAGFSAWLLLHAAPFSRPLRVLLAGSYFLLYEYAVVARNYALGVLLLFLIAAAWKLRFTRPMLFAVPLALLPSTSVHMLIIAFWIAALYVFDSIVSGRINRSMVLASLTVLGGGLAAFVQLFTREATQRPGWFQLRNPDAVMMVARDMFPAFGRVADVANPAYLLATPFLLAFALLLSNSPRLLLLFVSATGCLLYVFAFKYISGSRHPGIVFLMAVFTFWVYQVEQAESGEPPTRHLACSTSFSWASYVDRRVRPACIAVFTLAALVSAVTGLGKSAWDVRYQFSHSRQMADFIRVAGLEGRPMITTIFTEAVIAYLPPSKSIYLADMGRFGSRINWTVRDLQAADQIVHHLPEKVSSSGMVNPGTLILSHEPIGSTDAFRVRLLYETRGEVGTTANDRFFLYEIEPAQM